MTFKPMQHSVAIVNAICTSTNGTIDALLDSLSVRSEQLEQAFLTELAHLDELYTDQENDDNALALVQRFDKGYAKTMASIQAATERLIEARAHLARITNTIEIHPAFSQDGPVYIAAGVKVESGITEANIRRSNDSVIISEDCLMKGTVHTIEPNPNHTTYRTKENDHE